MVKSGYELKINLVLATTILIGCADNSQNETTYNPLISECWGGMSAEIAFTGSIPEQIHAKYTRRFAKFSGAVEDTIDECSLENQFFYRTENKVYVGFANVSGYSPEVFDLKVVDCSTGQEILSVQNVIPAVDERGAYCEIAWYQFIAP